MNMNTWNLEFLGCMLKPSAEGLVCMRLMWGGVNCRLNSGEAHSLGLYQVLRPVPNQKKNSSHHGKQIEKKMQDVLE
jgi:hypothetical protein